MACHTGQRTCTSGRKCISTHSTPPPSQRSQRPPDTLNEKGWAVKPRWRAAGFQTLIWVKRSRQALAGGAISEEISYYLSNVPVDRAGDGVDLCGAIRGHWRVETMHYRRDVVLSEDALRTRKNEVSRLMSSLRTLTMNLLHRLKPKNMAAQLDAFADNVSALLQFMKLEAVL